MRALRHKPQHRRLPLDSRGIKGWTPPGGTCLILLASWPPPKRQGQDFHPPRPRPSLRTRATAAWASLPTGGTQRGSAWPIIWQAVLQAPPLPLRSGFPAARVTVWGREAAAGLGEPRCAVLGAGDAPTLGSGGEEPPPCRSPRALNSPELGPSLALFTG